MKKPTIICVDDERMILNSLRSQLRRHLGTNFTVETVESGNEALELYQELKEDGYPIPVIISDQIMPGMKGDELLTKLNKLDASIKKILLTGQASVEAVGNAINNASLYRYMAKPWEIEDLNLTVTEAINSYFKENELKKSEKAREELINELKSVNESLEEKVQERTQTLEQKNRDITSSINYAKLIQDSILPSEQKIKTALPNSFVLYQPKDIVSGDFYWINHNKEMDKVYFSVADSTGHGVPGAFMSIIGSSLFNEAVKTDEFIKPNEIFNYVKEGIIKVLNQRQTAQKDGIDAALVSYDKTKQTIYFSGAFNPLYIIRDTNQPLVTLEGEIIDPDMELEGKKLYSIKGDKQPLAHHADSTDEFTVHKLQANEGDELFLFSDGFVDQFGGSMNKKYMRKRFKQLLLSVFGKPNEQQESTLLEAFNEWKGSFEQVDDICVMGVRL
ncbi:response regulator [Paracrocinitomix mangrovi]|uniref:SpoIIE family protein phosphatase n=1 Tax=Paracrocinitomix mangrovi TaxID=2862509 RepID=UPI001C8F192D|nr:SpoIIE family protein phosphatase [Paracrocinitomix mangrovi]UKN02063.1 response regulator [Paracrocinitomix mangrovi]